eukprot:scpid26374/ scgid1804/ G protein-coupled receptor kinase 5; G protein-coupled receptor kinase GRK5
MISDLENIVANTMLVTVRNGEGDGDGKRRGKSKNWRKYIPMPNIAKCSTLREELDIDFNYLFDHQPIGKELFERFCQNASSSAAARNSLCFLNKVAVFSVAVAEKRHALAEEIVTRCLVDTESRPAGVTEEQVTNCQERLAVRPTPSNFFEECNKAIREQLSGDIYSQFKESLYYDRYLQFKWVERQPLHKKLFREFRVLGKGGFGEVCACQCKATGKMYAMKKLEKKRVKKKKSNTMALNEKEILEQLSSRFIVSLAYACETKKALCMVLTLMNGGDLKYHIHTMAHANGRTGLERDRAIFYAAEICCGLQHMHEKSIVYRDMKPENILLDGNGHVRISDLGLAIHLPPGKAAHGRVGTVGYMAPEVIKGERYRYAIDWWGLGCLVYEMFQGQAPFRQRKEKVSREEVERRTKEDEVQYSSNFTDEARELCSKLLEKNYQNRLSKAHHIKRLSFFQSISWPHLEAGLVDPPYEPDKNLVYAKDVLDIDEFTSVHGVVIDGDDKEFHSRFASGCVSEPWQQELIDEKVFAELNAYGPDDTRSPDLIPCEVEEAPRSSGIFSWFRRQRVG